MSQLLLSDGRTVDPSALTPGSTRQSSFSFPHEEPTTYDFELWRATIKTITSPSFILSPPLGRFLCRCAEFNEWQIVTSKQYLVHTRSSEQYDIFIPMACEIRTRRYPRFVYSHSTRTPPVCTLTASVTQHPDGTLFLYSTSSLYDAGPPQFTSFLARLKARSQPRLWNSSVIDEDGDWIPAAAQNSSLVMVHDGSYMPGLDPSICSAALVIFCTQTGRMGRIKMCEKTDLFSASNYRAEIIGGLLASHVLSMLNDMSLGQASVKLYCDNLGVVHHAHHPHRPLSERQPHSDVLTVFTKNLRDTRIHWEYHHVYGHMDDTTSFQDLNLPQQLNVIADALAKEALSEAKRANKFCLPLYPNEQIRVLTGGSKATSSFRTALYRSWGYQQARDLFHKRKIIHSKHFHLVNWEGVYQVMQALPQMYKVWVTKHVSGFCGTHRHLSVWTHPFRISVRVVDDETKTNYT